MVLFSGAEFILNVFGSDFNGGFLVIAILLPGFAAEGALGAAKQTLTMSGHNKINVVNLSIVFSLNLLLGIFLIPRYGAAGAAASLSLTYLLLNIIRVVQVHMFLKVLPFTKSSMNNVIVFSLILIGVSAWLRLGFDSIVVRTSAAIAISAALTLSTVGIYIFKTGYLKKQ